jgi:hypothetical protein
MVLIDRQIKRLAVNKADRDSVVANAPKVMRTAVQLANCATSDRFICK